MWNVFLACLCRVGSTLAYVEWVPLWLMSSGFLAWLCRVGSTFAYVEWVPRLLMLSGFHAC